MSMKPPGVDTGYGIWECVIKLCSNNQMSDTQPHCLRYSDSLDQLTQGWNVHILFHRCPVHPTNSMMFRSIPIDILILAHFYTGVRCHLCRQKPCCIFRSTDSCVSDNSEIKQVETRDVASRELDVGILLFEFRRITVKSLAQTNTLLELIWQDCKANKTTVILEAWLMK